MPKPKGKKPAGKPKQAPKSVWSGPDVDGITYSQLCRFLCCRERFRLRMVEGWKETHTWDHKIQYGQIWHEGEEAFAAGKDFSKAMLAYVKKLSDEYPDNAKDIIKWYEVAKVQFPIYVAHWKKKDREQSRRKALYQEKEFRLPYQLPSGRMVVLRGKIDSIFSLGKQVFVQENKTKGQIDIEGLQSTVAENLQTMFYQVVLRKLAEQPGFLPKGYKPAGVLYNVIRRPLSDFRSIRQGKKETDKEFMKRLSGDITEKADNYFYRWKVEIEQRDIDRFTKEIFHPILEQLSGWWSSIKHHPFDPWRIYLPDTEGNYHPQFVNNFHWRNPFGLYNAMANGFAGEFRDYILYGRKSGMERTTNLFPELSEP